MLENKSTPINLYIIDYYKEKKDNGLNTYVAELGRAFEKIDDIALTYVWVESNNPEISVENGNRADHIFVPRFRRTADNKNQSDAYLTTVLEKHIDVKENVLIHLNWINHCSLAWHIRQKIKCKIVLTKHCVPWRDLVTVNYREFYRLDDAFNKKKKVPLNLLQLHQEEINYEFVDHIITVTDYARENLELLFNVKPEKITVIYNGIDLKVSQRTEKLRAKLRRQYGFGQHEQIVIFAHVLHARKGIVDLVKIFEEFLKDRTVHQTRLIIAGNGDGTRIAETAKRYWANITLTGNLSKSTLYDFYQLADVGIVPSFAEQCSYTAIEMMRFGLPIIVSEVEGLKEIVPLDCGLRIKVDFRKDGVTLNSKDLRQKLAFLLKDKEAAKQLSVNARKHASEAFSLEQMINNTLAVFREVSASEVRKQQEQPIDIPKQNTPFVSVLMPCYNAAAYLRACMDSILNQSYSNFELLIIDDGSTDNTLEILKSYSDKRIRLLVNKENKGIAHTLNKGLKIIKGKYLARMDADDIMSPNRLALQVNFLEKNPKYGMVGAWHEIIDGYGMVIKRLQRPVESKHLKLQLYFNNPFIHPLVMMRTELAKQLRYDPKFLLCEDYDLWTRISAVTEVANLPQYLLQYRVHNKNISSSDEKTIKQNVLNLLSRELDKLNISYTPKELVMHGAISFSYGSNYFNTQEKGKLLSDWLNKVFSSPKFTETFSQGQLNKFKRGIIQNQYGFPIK
ncbi:glycosyltransferase involved in cell wall biosynthesis [Mucilaginibacter oryzae]|uniref:Glycosyltransferase involved in cell wall biosynthesis n=1 Tax=Mucilaginibacter oryzae TaxID=468058 RepID=A0A316GSU2_9SPHI|nr:glycosyltransferase [Mucilaginibacter oryzae]PWK65394.1 glycosyltransferase involved in cell wall biosynthesis [Mucilaginibacter oryzae]